MSYGPYSFSTSVDGEDHIDVYVDGETRKTKLSTLRTYTDGGTPSDLSSVDWSNYRADILDLSDDSYWDDLKVPATSINPAGQAAPPDVDQNTGGPSSLHQTRQRSLVLSSNSHTATTKGPIWNRTSIGQKRRVHQAASTGNSSTSGQRLVR